MFTKPFLDPNFEENEILNQLEQAKLSRDNKRIKELKEHLVRHYVKYGEYFKMDRPDPNIAIGLLQNALKLVPKHAIACYRLAHLYYRKNQFEKAAIYFKTALESNRPEPLNDTQRYIALLFLSNCGIMISKAAVVAIQEMEFQLDLQVDVKMINQYRDEIVVTEVESFNHLYYRKITADGEDFISLEQFNRLQDERHDDTVLLITDENGFSVKHRHVIIEPLHLNAFYVLHTIVTSNSFLTNRDIYEKIIGRGHEEINEDTIRKIIQRLTEQLPFWETIIETTKIGRKKARRLKQLYSYIVLCRVGDVLPDDY